jgi:hypothetical protein
MIYITRKHVSRRQVLRGVGSVAIALPFLDAMHPAMAQERLTAAAPVRRLGILYFPHGATDRWLPSGEGATFTLSPGLAPLERHKKKLLVIAGLSSDPDRSKPGFHNRAIASWLTGCEPTRGKVEVGISMDQVAAAHFAKETQFGSLELATEPPNITDGAPFYRDAHTMLPVEGNPRVVFERLFGDSSKIDPVEAARRNEEGASALDSALEEITALNRRLGPSDRRKLDQYLGSIRDVERRLQLAASTQVAELPNATRPAGIPDTYSEHVKLLFDMQALAFQADMTRVISFQYNTESSLMTFREIGVDMQHHEASHHNYDQAKLDALHKINVLQSELFAYYLDKLDAIKEPSGSMLDNSIIFFGSSLSNPTVHSQRDLPVVLAGGANGRLDTGRFLRFPGDTTPLSNMHLTLLDKLGVPTEKLGDSVAPLKLDRISI